MWNKKVIVGILCLGLYIGFIVGTISYVKAEGQASANVIKAPPTIVQQQILDASFTPTGTMVPDATFYLNISVNDVDTVGDILNTTVTLRYLSIIAPNDPLHTYRFCYNETQALAYQIYPTTGTYLQNTVRTTFGANMVNYSFEVILNKTAIESEGIPTRWSYNLNVQDNSTNPNTTASQFFIMGPFIEFSYWGNAGGMNFNWTGEAETNQSVSFNTLTTANGNYDLNCSYTGSFGAPWGSPIFWIKESSKTNATLIPDVSTTPGQNSTWFTRAGGPIFWNNQTHTIALVFPAGLTIGTYTGVTIWIQARNI